MLELEAKLGRTLEDDFREYYVDKGWGQKRLAKRWGINRTNIFGRGAGSDQRSWVQMLDLPIRQNTSSTESANRTLPSCEVCSITGVPLENAHWIPAAKGGDATSANILKLCPNCHTRLDLSEETKVAVEARAILLARVARRFIESRKSFSREDQIRFVQVCQSIIERRSKAGT